MDLTNGYEHQCPCCGYTVKIDWEAYEYINGDEDFIRIDSGLNKSRFETNKSKNDYFGSYYEIVLLGCPKCKCVSFQFD